MLYLTSFCLCSMANGEAKRLLHNKLSLLGMAVILGALAANFSGTAFAVTANDPDARYNCYQVDDKGQFKHQTDADGKPTDQLIPCDINTGDNAWMLTSAALVLMMTPAGLAIFYGGLARQKNSVNTLHMVFITTGIIAIQYVL